MKKSIHIGSVSIPLDSYVVGATAVLGIRDSGKTYGTKGIAEQLLDFGIAPIIFDPVGRWRYLKIAGTDSKKPKAYKIVVAGGEQPDLPLTPQSAPEIVRAAIRENIPLVLDLYDRKLSKADWRRIVQSCFRTLFYENQGPRHVFLEEAAEFAPQKVLDGETYAEVEKFVRMGGNVSLGITLINQRAQEVNKAILDLCSTLVLMRQRGSHAIDSLEKQMDRLDPDTAQAVAKSLPHMRSGDAWVFTETAEKPVRTRTAPIRSFHPNRQKPQLSDKVAASRTANTEDFVSRLTGKLDAVIAEAQATDPVALRRRVAELEKALKAGKVPPALIVDTQAIDRAYARGRSEAVRDCQTGVTRILKDLHLSMDKAVGSTFDPDFDRIKQLGESVRIAVVSQKAPIVSRGTPAVSQKESDVSRKPPKRLTVPPAPSGIGTLDNAGPLPKGEALILRACIQHSGGISREALTVLTGYKRSSRDEYINRLRAKLYVTTAGNTVLSTPEGRAAMPDAEPLPSGDALLEFWRHKLPQGERKILEILIKAFPDAVYREDLNAAGFKRSSRDEYINRLCSRQLATKETTGIRASSNLFSEFINP